MNGDKQAAPPSDGAEQSEVRLETVEGVGWIILNRPDASNGAYPPLMRALCQAIDRHSSDPGVKALVIRGEGRHFLAGGDLNWLSTIAAGEEASAADEIYEWFQGATRRLMACPKPTIAAITGAAFTVGCELVLACDVRLVDRTAFLVQNWLDLGLVAPLGGAMLLPRIVGWAKAKEMLLECQRIGAEEAVSIGLANELLESQEALYRRAQERALAMTSRSPAAYAAMKRLVHSGLSCPLEQGWKEGIAAQAEQLQSADFRSAVAARMRK